MSGALAGLAGAGPADGDLGGGPERARGRAAGLQHGDRAARLDDAEDVGGGVLDDRPGGAIIGIARPDPQPGTALDPHFVPVRNQFARALRGQPDAVFVVLDFLDGADAHGDLLWAKSLQMKPKQGNGAQAPPRRGGVGVGAPHRQPSATHQRRTPTPDPSPAGRGGGRTIRPS